MIYHVVMIFNKAGDERIIGKIILENARLGELQGIFELGSHDLLADCHPIGENQRIYFEGNFALIFDFDKYLYFATSESD